jgi:regulator of replication initiation timing
MTEDDRLLIDNLKRNTQQLFNKCKNLEQQNVQLHQQLVEIKDQNKLLEQEKSELSRMNEQLKIAGCLLSKDDENGAAKQKINILIREIDKCIALLNK